jgi:hypothetical protein
LPLAPVIPLRDHLTLADRTPLVEDGVCRCGSKGTLDFIDLVAQGAKYHCPTCNTLWECGLVDPVDPTERARLDVARAEAAARRRRR